MLYYAIMAKEMKADFCIEIDFQKGSESPSRIFRTMTELIETFQAFDQTLIESIDAKIEPVAVIEDIETGSLKAWLSYVLRAIDDDALKSLDWKPAVGKYLVKAKYLIVNFMEGKTEIATREEVQELETQLLKSAEETDVTHFPSYIPVQRQKLLPTIGRLSNALKNLTDKEKAVYITAGNDVQMNGKFNIVPERLEELLTHEVIESTSEMILKVKKPDYLGDSMWELRHGTRTIDVKITDTEWLKNFQNRKYDVRPGDSLRGTVKTITRYGYDNEVVGISHEMTNVKGVIALSPTTQIPLIP